MCSSTRIKMVTGSFLILAMAAVAVSGAWGNNDRIRLEDVNVLTLYNGKMTTGRRSSPVPQLKCIGGSAAGAFNPQVVQCINKGSDGYDVQWECKTDMDNKYRFGTVEVVCEGYDHADDPFILKGSCGLEYTLELTEEGRQKQPHGSHHSGHYGGHHDYGYHDSSHYHHGSGFGKKVGSVLGDLVWLAIIAGLIYIVYRTCIATPARSDDPPPYDDHQRRDFHGSQPPPYGFRQDYMPNDDSCSSGQTYSGAGHTGNQTHTPGTGTGGGFWSGAATGGLLGYLFGSRTNTYHHTPHHRPYSGWGSRGWGWGNGWGSGWGTGNTWGSGWNTGGTRTTFTSGGGGGSSSSSSGTRTASGFGGTRRR